MWEERPEEMRAALAEHDAIVRGAIDAHDGYVFSTGGDGFAVAFSRAGDAVDAAVRAQAALAGHRLIRVRMGLHTGEVHERGGDYFGPAVNRAARLMAIGHGGQVLASAVTAALLDAAVPTRDLGEHRLRDLSAPQRVLQLGDGSFPALRSVDVVPSNLPVVLTELVGRGDDIAELSQLVRRDRIVTLTGTGGVGKTRLALGVAAAVAAEFSDGVWLAELAPVADSARIDQAVAAALGVGVAVDGRAGLVSYLQARRLVLVLDNCEQVLDSAAEFVSAVVSAAPEVHVIVTSREPLGVDGEVVRRVRSLGLPDDADDPSAIDGSDAVRMFVERAGAASGDFQLNAGNRAAVAEVCRRLDGIPLAIELAAARARAMTPAQIAARLDERFRLLSGARRTQERHRTLQAAVSWSYDLLSPEEQRVFWRLSILPSSFDTAAADAVAGDDADVLDDLLRLVDRSLVQHDPITGRYRLLETLRQFGADRAVEAGEADEIRGRYVDHFRGVVATNGPRYEAPESFSAAEEALSVELDNITAVAGLLVDDQAWRQLHDLCLSMAAFMNNYAPASFARWLGAATDAGACVDDQERIDALGWVAYGLFNSGGLDTAAGRATESLALAARRDGDPSPWALWTLGTLAQVAGRWADCLAHFDAAVNATAHRACYTQLLIRATWLQGFLLDRGFDGNEPVIEEVLRETSEHPVTSVIAALAVAMPLAVAGDAERGRRYLEAVSEQSIANPVLRGWFSMAKAMALIDAAPHAAVGYAIEAVHSSDRAGNAYSKHGATLTLAVLAGRIGRVDLAARLHAHTEAFPDFHGAHGYVWLLVDIDAALVAAGMPTPVTPQELTRQELFAIIAELEAES